MKTQVDTADETYDYILTAEDRLRFSPRLGTDEFLSVMGQWILSGSSPLESEFYCGTNYRRKKAVQADQWREIDASEVYRDVWCWNTHGIGFQTYQAKTTGIALLASGHTHWESANAPKAGPRAKTQEERDREAFTKYHEKIGVKQLCSEESRLMVDVWLAAVKYGRNPQP